MKKQEMAFPSEALGQTGMTLRDWFAGMALSGFIAGTKKEEWDDLDYSDFARFAYHQADSVLEERNK